MSRYYGFAQRSHYLSCPSNSRPHSHLCSALYICIALYYIIHVDFYIYRYIQYVYTGLGV